MDRKQKILDRKIKIQEKKLEKQGKKRESKILRKLLRFVFFLDIKNDIEILEYIDSELGNLQKQTTSDIYTDLEKLNVSIENIINQKYKKKKQ